MGLSRTIFVVLGVVALLATLARPAYAPDCNLPDLSSCACYLGVGPWPIGAAAVGDLLAAADLTVGTRTSCFQHGGQPYWQIQRQVTLPAGAEAIAHLDPNFEVDNPPNAWCTETIAFWAERAGIPYPWGFYSSHHLSSYVETITEIRTWYQAEEEKAGIGRGRWIDGSELDHDGFVPGVNGPCPSAYQQIDAFNRTDPDGDGTVWTPGNGHSQMIDTLIIHRLGNATGPIVSIDVTMIEGNVGFTGTIFSRVINRRRYNDIIDFTTLGPDANVLDSKNRKIRGWGINLNSDGTVYCDSSRIRTEVTLVPRIFSLPAGPENSDSLIVAQLVNFHLVTGGGSNFLVSSTSNLVQHGGAFPTPQTSWIIPPAPHPVDPVYIEIDLTAEHPVPVKAVTFEWVEAIPAQFEIQWAGNDQIIQFRTVSLVTPMPAVPMGTVLPLTVALSPGNAFPIRYLRLCILNSELTQTFQIARVHYHYFHDEVEDNGGVSPEGDPVLSGVTNDDVPPAGAWLRAAYPNPFRDRAEISFSVPSSGAVQVTVYDVLGRRVQTILHEVVSSGTHSVSWNGRDEVGRELPSGVYFVRLAWEGEVHTSKIVIAR